MEDTNERRSKLTWLLLEIYFKEFYFILTTLSVVGYGDGISLPDISNFENDRGIWLLMMLAGLFVFSFFSGKL